MPAPRTFLKPYHAVWAWLFLAWTVCYIDRSLTGPVVSWMIAHQAGFMAAAPMQHALGGIIGSMFFAGYMLTQFPAGYLGDRFGHRAMVVISTAWAGVTTMASGFARTLFSFVGLRVLTGLGEGAYYSNDRAIVEAVTPPERKGLGMGVVFIGLAAGLTIATTLTPAIMDWAEGEWGGETAWTVPFLIYAPITLAVSFGLGKVLSPRRNGERPGPALGFLALVSIPMFAAIMLVFFLTLELGMDSVLQAVAVLIMALVLVAIIFKRLGRESTVLHDRDLVLMYATAIPILYTLWFFGFWALLLVSESSHLGLVGAAVYAGLFGVASAIGYPVGGWLCDRASGRGRGRRDVYVVLCLSVAFLVMLMAWGISGGELDLGVMGALLFLIGVLFSAMQTVHMTLTSDLAPRRMMGQAFGMWNLVGEIGAVLSPVVSGALRDATGDWTLSTMVTAGLLLLSAAGVMAVGRKGRCKRLIP
ncbi:MAG: putative 3-hydroxyphenylpropionic transporter MhpT [Methanomassiliicoccales archaeon PtaU1.Bin124]|nr:MAG: putative 3-hydroxyphenylpropionic transporter MhpT [Methanomassiliicoccales archaeon PtaU1.Bin124]